jgi:outer membrane lipoprotein carrier protein
MCWIRPISSSLLLAFVCIPLLAAEQDRGQRLVDSFLADVKTLQADFEQTLIGADGEVLEESSGTLEISRPGRFRWSYREPYEQQLLADGLNIWSYDVDLAQVSVKPQSVALANTPALLLSGTNDALQEFNDEGSYVDGGLTWVRMAPKNTDSGFKRVELGFDSDSLTRMVFYDNLEQTTVVILNNVIVNAAIDDEVFVFELPEDVDVVGTPAAMRGGAN